MNVTASEAVLPLLSETEAAKILGISSRTLWTLRTKGEVKALKIGSRVLYDHQDLRAFIDMKKRGSALETSVVGCNESKEQHGDHRL